MSDKLRIMWMSNAPWCGTGYGVQASKLIPFLKERPEVEDVALFAFYGIQGGITKQKIGKHWITCYPLGANPYGNDIVQDWIRDFNADIIITLLDVFILEPQFGHNLVWVPYAPIDHDPLPPSFIERFRNSYRPIVYSKFAVKKMQEVGLECWYAPHGVDTNIFKPRSNDWNGKARDWLKTGQDKFVVGMVAANKDPSDRKGFNEAMAAFRNLLDKHPDCEMYIHSVPTQEQGGYDLIGMAHTYGIQNHVKFTLRHLAYAGLHEEDLAKVYNTFDVFLNPCHRAGFEIPLIEAQASGVPVIAGDWHSMTELVGSGWLIEPAQRLYSPLQSYTYMPSIDSITECLLDAYENRGNPVHKQTARDFAMEYDWKYVLSKYWGPIISQLSEELEVRVKEPFGQVISSMPVGASQPVSEGETRVGSSI